MSPPRELPVRPLGICVYPVRGRGAEAEYLLLRRHADEPDIPGVWQPVSGTIEPGEAAWQTAVRELREETGLKPTELYSANIVQQFYSHVDDCIIMFPVFVAFVEDGEVALCEEHDGHVWAQTDQAEIHLAFEQQVTSLREIDRRFVRRPPCEHLRIPLLGLHRGGSDS